MIKIKKRKMENEESQQEQQPLNAKAAAPVAPEGQIIIGVLQCLESITNLWRLKYQDPRYDALVEKLHQQVMSLPRLNTFNSGDATIFRQMAANIETSMGLTHTFNLPVNPKSKTYL